MVPGLVWSLSRWICYGSSRTVVGLVPRNTRRQLEPLRAQLSVCESEQPRPVLPEQQPRVPPRPGADSVRVVRRCVPGRAGGMSTLAKDWLGNWEYWEFWDYWEL